MIVCYLDDSDAVESSVLTLAGYAAPASAWSTYEDHAEKIYQKYNINLLHAKEFHGTKDQFKGWSYVRKRKFIDELYRLSGDFLGIAHSIHKSRYAHRRRQDSLMSQRSPYGVLFNALCNGFVDSPISKDAIAAHGISFIIEKGHKNDREVELIFNSLQKIRGENLKSISFSTKDGSKAIHLADLFAFYARRQAAKMTAHKDITVATAEDLEEKMFSLVTSQCRHILVNDVEPLSGEWQRLDSSKAKKPMDLPQLYGRHLYSTKGRPQDP